MLLFFDIDGTLWNSDNYIPESAKNAIHVAQTNGHKCFINTGRARSFVYNKELLDIGFDGILSACGCMIEYNSKVVFNRLINREDSLRTLSAMKKYGFKPILEGPTYLYMNRSDFEGDFYGEKVMREMGTKLLSIDDNWGHWEMNKLSCICPSDTRDKCFEELSDLYDYMLHTETIVELVPKGFNKGTGILEICQILGEDPKNTVAFGDSINDKEMLETAGTAVAMGKSMDEAKALADLVTDNLEENGIWNAMKKLSLI
ncbi:MAG: HAD family hydrolase [Butyrivibrio sp.]|nr:HAD family hydrolase [Butyrivibrio sp.]